MRRCFSLYPIKSDAIGNLTISLTILLTIKLYQKHVINLVWFYTKNMSWIWY